MTTTRVEISLKTIVSFISIILGLWFLYAVRGIIILLFIAFILMTAVNPVVNFARKRKIPVLLVLFLIYVGVIALMSIVVASLVPAVLEQSRALSQNIPGYLKTVENSLNIKLDPSFGSSYMSGIPSNLLKFAAGAFSNILNILAVFFITYYLTVERSSLHRYLTRLFGGGNEEKKAENLFLAVEKQVGGWVRGELFLMLVIGVMTYFGLLLLGIPYALPLAVLAGTLELVPTLGPVFAAVPAILLGLTISPLVGLGATIMSVLIQQLENNFIVPKIMQSATGTKPLITMLVLLTGYTLGGTLGAILSMPLYLAAQTVYEHISHDQTNT